MTLFRQLLFFTLALCFILFTLVWVDKLQSTRAFLSAQLQSSTQDTATSLGISLSPFLARDDRAAAETMINAVFDRGYLRLISLLDNDGAVVIERSSPLSVGAVPGWFIELIPLSSPGASALIMNGWNKAGSVYVESHPGYAYLTLWQTAVRVTIYFLLAGVVVLVLGATGLRFLLRPLGHVERQAEAICHREFQVQEKIPRTRELRQVVVAMNRMTVRVRELFEEQAVIADKLRQRVFGDSLTGLANRRLLAAQVNGMLDHSLGAAKRSFMLIKIHHLDEINKNRGYNAGDELLQQCGALICEAAALFTAHSAARLSGADFGLFLPVCDEEDCQRLAERITSRLAGLAGTNPSVAPGICSLGAVSYTRPASFEHLLAQADVVLAAALQAGPNQWRHAIIDQDEGLSAQGKRGWQRLVEKALDRNELLLYGQRVANCADLDVSLHLEIFCRIGGGSDQPLPAGVFLPAVENSTLLTALDRQVVEGVLHHYPRWSCTAVAINISAASLADAAFAAWLGRRLDTLPRTAPRLYFEIAEFSALQHLEAIQIFGRRLRLSGHGLGIDHFGRKAGNFDYLKSLQPDYVKIDAAFTRELGDERGDSYFFIGALTGVAHSLAIKVIAEGVEQHRQLEMLRELNLDGIQGYLVEQPAPLKRAE